MRRQLLNRLNAFTRPAYSSRSLDLAEGLRLFSRKTRSNTEKRTFRVAVISAKKHKRQRRKRQSETAEREKSQTPKFLTALNLLNLTQPNLT